MLETNKGWKQPIPVKIDGLNPFETTVFQKILLRCRNISQNIKVADDNTYINLEKGQCVVGRFEFAKEFGFSEKESLRVYRIIKKLEKVNKLMNIQRTKNCSIVTVQNYDDWVSLEQTNEQTVNKQRTNSEQTVNTNKSDKSVKPVKPNPLTPLEGEPDEWRNLITRFATYRTEIGKPYKSPSAIKGLLNKLKEHGIDTATKMVDQSIANQWQGVFELKGGQGSKEESADEFFSKLEDAIDQATEEHLKQQKYV